jgi:photosystem II stability/assembly factor-like uncharacterized protein
VSFISPSTGWALASGARCPQGRCRAVVLRTTDGGRSWHRVNTPKEVALRDAKRPGAVAGIAFANRRDGWLYGGDLWVTHDGGRHWARGRIANFTVESLAVAKSTVYVVGAACNTAGQQCQFGRLYQAPIGGTRFRHASGLPQFGTAGGGFSGSVTVAAGVAYLQEAHFASRLRLYALTSVGWVRRVAPCAANSGLFGTLTAAGPRALLEVCANLGRGPGIFERAYRSLDGGVSWRRLADPPAGTAAVAVAAASARRFVVVTESSRVDLSRDGGANWSTRLLSAHPRLGWVQIEFVSPRVGYAVPGQPHAALLRTTNGGLTWHPVRV